MEATQMSIDRWMDKEIVVYIYNGIPLNIKKNTFESILVRWMKLEPAIVSKMSEIEKQILYINIYS